VHYARCSGPFSPYPGSGRMPVNLSLW
jgi:hypothetical protein